jgi:hypothetical protein
VIYDPNKVGNAGGVLYIHSSREGYLIGQLVIDEQGLRIY